MSNHDFYIGTLWAMSNVLIGTIVPILMRYMRDGIHFSIGPFWFSAGLCFWSPILHTVLTKPKVEDSGEIILP